MNTAPSRDVVSRNVRHRRWSPRWIADTASTIVSELNSSTKHDTDVNGMSNSSCGRRARSTDAVT